MAIINPLHITPYANIPANEVELSEDLIFNRRPDALQRYIEYFEQIDPTIEDTSVDPTEGMTPEERLHWRIVHRHKEGVEADIDVLIVKETSDVSETSEVLTHHETAVHVLNTVLLPAMKEVGDKFGTGELILPFVLQSAEVMKKAVWKPISKPPKASPREP